MYLPYNLIHTPTHILTNTNLVYQLIYMTKGCLVPSWPSAEPCNLVAPQSEKWKPQVKGTNGECQSEGEAWTLSSRVPGVRPCWKAEDAGIWYPRVMKTAIDALTWEKQSSADWLLPSLAFCPIGAPSLQRHCQKCHPISIKLTIKLPCICFFVVVLSKDLCSPGSYENRGCGSQRVPESCVCTVGQIRDLMFPKLNKSVIEHI